MGPRIQLQTASALQTYVWSLSPSWVCPDGGSLGLSYSAGTPGSNINRGGYTPVCLRDDDVCDDNVFLYLPLVVNVAFFVPFAALRLATRGARKVV